MARTDTTSVRFMTIARPQQDVTFEFHPREGAYTTIIRIPEHSKWSPSPHWHERYTEHFRVLQGRAVIVVDGVSRVIEPTDGEQRIEPFSVHEFMRADRDAPHGKSESGEVVVEERVAPADGTKEVFFRTIFSTIQDSSKYFGRLTGLQIRMTSYAFDNFDVLVPGRFAWFVTHAFYAISYAVAWAVGLRPWYEEYTPARLRDAAISGGNPGKLNAKLS